MTTRSARMGAWMAAGLAVAVLGVGLRAQVSNVLHRARQARAFLGTSPAEAERLLLGEENAAALRALRTLIPPDGLYGLAVAPGGLGDAYAVRYALAPRRAVLVQLDARPAAGSIPVQSLPAASFVVLSMKGGEPPILVVPPGPRATGHRSAADAVAPTSLLDPERPPPLTGRRARILPILRDLAARGLKSIFILVSILGSGAWAARLLPVRSPWPVLGAFAWSWLFGVGTLGALGLAASAWLGLPLDAATSRLLVGAACLAGLVTWLAFRRRGHSMRPQLLPRLASGRSPSSRIHTVVVAALFCVTAILFAQAFLEPVSDWDGRMTWVLHGKYMRADGTATPFALRSPGTFVTHPRYPPLLPLVQAVALEAFDADGAEDRLVRPIYAMFFPATAIVLLQAAYAFAGRQAAGIVGLLLACLPALSLMEEGGPGSTYSDAPLAAFFGGAVILALRFPDTVGSSIASGALLAAIVLTKNEGSFLCLVPLVIATLRAIRRLPRGEVPSLVVRLGILWSLPLLAYGLLGSWQSSIPNRWDEAYGKGVLSGISWMAVRSHLGAAAPEIARAFLDWRLWSVFWIAVPIVAAAGIRRLRKPLFLSLLVSSAAPLGLGLAAYAFTSWGDIADLVRVSWHRLLLQGSIPGLLAFALLLPRKRSDLKRD